MIYWMDSRSFVAALLRMTRGESGHYLLTALIPDRQRVDRTARAGAQQTRAIHRLRCAEDSDVLVVEDERVRRGRDAVAEADAQSAVDLDPQASDDAFVRFVAHIPSRPSSSRARSMIAGVISAIARSRA